MTGRKQKKVTKFYDRLSTEERIKMLFKADVNGEIADSEIRNSVPPTQVADYNHTLGALNSIYSVIVPTAAEVMYRTNILQMQYMIAWTHICWANDRIELMSGKDPQTDLPVPGNPVGVVPVLTPEGLMIPESELASVDKVTRSYLVLVRSDLPKCSREKNAVQHVYGELKSEFSAEDLDEPVVRELLDITTRMLLTLQKATSWLFDLDLEDFDTPDPHFLELLNNAVDVARKEPR